MARELRLPELAESVVEGEIVRWMVEEGDQIELDQPVVEVMTDKVTVELPSPYAGKLIEKVAAEGEVVGVKLVRAGFDGRGGGAAVAAPAPAPSLKAEEERIIVEGGRPAVEVDGESLSLFKPGGGSEEPLITVRRPTATAVTS